MSFTSYTLIDYNSYVERSVFVADNQPVGYKWYQSPPSSDMDVMAASPCFSDYQPQFLQNTVSHPNLYYPEFKPPDPPPLSPYLYTPAFCAPYMVVDGSNRVETLVPNHSCCPDVPYNSQLNGREDARCVTSFDRGSLVVDQNWSDAGLGRVGEGNKLVEHVVDVRREMLVDEAVVEAQVFDEIPVIKSESIDEMVSDGASALDITPQGPDKFIETTDRILLQIEEIKHLLLAMSSPSKRGEVIFASALGATADGVGAESILGETAGLFTGAEESVKEGESVGGKENGDTTAGYEPWNIEWDWDDGSDGDDVNDVGSLSDGIAKECSVSNTAESLRFQDKYEEARPTTVGQNSVQRSIAFITSELVEVDGVKCSRDGDPVIHMKRAVPGVVRVGKVGVKGQVDCYVREKNWLIYDPGGGTVGVYSHSTTNFTMPRDVNLSIQSEASCNVPTLSKFTEAEYSKPELEGLSLQHIFLKVISSDGTQSLAMEGKVSGIDKCMTVGKKNLRNFDPGGGKITASIFTTAVGIFELSLKVQEFNQSGHQLEAVLGVTDPLTHTARNIEVNQLLLDQFQAFNLCSKLIIFGVYTVGRVVGLLRWISGHQSGGNRMLSTLSNWAKEFRKWLPKMNVIVYVGARASRGVCQQYEFYSDKKNGRGIKFDVLLTTYKVILKDKGVLSRLKWNYLMVDETHRLKDSEAALYITLSEFSTKNKLLITGTPLQNSVEELWALLHFLDPDKFKGKDEFVQNYKNLSLFYENELFAGAGQSTKRGTRQRILFVVQKLVHPVVKPFVPKMACVWYWS